jgi:hypothetical protein
LHSSSPSAYQDTAFAMKMPATRIAKTTTMMAATAGVAVPNASER